LIFGSRYENQSNQIQIEFALDICWEKLDLSGNEDISTILLNLYGCARYLLGKTSGDKI
jgi:hypothetical protein